MVEKVNEQVLSDRQIVQEFAELRESGSELSWFERREIDSDGKSIDELLNALVRGLDLAQGLLADSQSGQAYVDEIRAMIQQNNLD